MAVDGSAGERSAAEPPAPGLSLYFALLWAGLCAKLEHRVDFLVMAGAAMLMQVLGYVFLWIVFRQIPSVAGWTLWELVVVYALVHVTEGAVSFFLEGLWRLNGLMHRGELDVMLVRPVSPLWQLAANDVGMNGLGNVALGGVMIGQALVRLDLDWGLTEILVAPVLLVSAVVVRGATVLAAASLGFWTGSPHNTAMHVVHSVASFAQFPLSIYGRGLQLVLTYAVPFAFISYYPAAWVLGKRHVGWVGLLTPLVALVAFGLARGLFALGLRRYESTGS